MAKHSNTVYFSLDKDSRDRLESLAHPNESIGLVAKRLILEMIGDDRQSSPIPPDIGDRLSDLEKQLAHVTEQTEARFALCAQDGDRLGELSDRLEQLENNQGLSPDDLERLSGILSRDYLGDRLDSVTEHLRELALRQIEIERAIAKLPPDLERRLGAIDDLLELVANFDPAPKSETAIMIQKRLPAAAAVCLSHEQAAELFGKSPRTIKGWAKDPNKWPEGWLYDSDKNYWTKQD
jgi:hypothetical protein